MIRLCLVLLPFVVFSCHAQKNDQRELVNHIPIINENGGKIVDRFNCPPGYVRFQMDTLSFSSYLRHLSLKQSGSRVKYYNGTIKSNTSIYCAVIDKDIGKRDLHQCADAVMRLKADYHYEKQEYDSIHFNFTNGFNAEYSKWREGKRIKVRENTVQWINTNNYSNDYASYWKYLEMVFSYAGTLSLSQELRMVGINQVRAGDIFIQGGSPGHAVIIVDECISPETGKKLYLLAQSYMPAQEIQVLKNPSNSEISPWYELSDKKIIDTPEWTFESQDLKRF